MASPAGFVALSSSSYSGSSCASISLTISIYNDSISRSMAAGNAFVPVLLIGAAVVVALRRRPSPCGAASSMSSCSGS